MLYYMSKFVRGPLSIFLARAPGPHPDPPRSSCIYRKLFLIHIYIYIYTSLCTFDSGTPLYLQRTNIQNNIFSTSRTTSFNNRKYLFELIYEKNKNCFF